MTEKTTSMEPIKAEDYDVTRFNALREFFKQTVQGVLLRSTTARRLCGPS
jgi:hypothetical protein